MALSLGRDDLGSGRHAASNPVPRKHSLGMSTYLQPQVGHDSLSTFSTASRVSPVRF